MQALPIAAPGLHAPAPRFGARPPPTPPAPLGHLHPALCPPPTPPAAVQANAAVIRTADRMTGALLDMLA